MLAATLLSFPALAQQPQRLVFAHYMVTNQDYQADTDPTQELKIAAYQREIREAQAAGIDGFALNVGGWLREPYYIRYTAQIFEAAARLHTGFRLMFSADMCCGNTAADVEDMLRRFAANPRYAAVYLQREGQPVLTTFAGDKLGVAAWQGIRDDLAHGTHPSLKRVDNALAAAAGPPGNTPMRIFLVPAFFWGGELPSPAAVSAGVRQWSSTIDGAFYWGIAGVPNSGGNLDQLPSSAAYASALHTAGKLYMAPVCLQFWGSNADRYYEYSGAAGMRSMWMQAIQTTHPEWVEIITWNDFIEGSYVSPIDDPNRYPGANFLDASHVPRQTLGYFHSHSAATALLPYFIQWYKTGSPPAITKDALYFFYRTQGKDLAATPSVAHIYGPFRSVVYITAHLTAPATLKTSFGARSTTTTLPAGSTDVEIPIEPGERPAFQLLRGSRIVASGEGAESLQEHPALNNLYYVTGVITPRASR